MCLVEKSCLKNVNWVCERATNAPLEKRRPTRAVVAEPSLIGRRGAQRNTAQFKESSFAKQASSGFHDHGNLTIINIVFIHR
jgi:hypothetical protein